MDLSESMMVALRGRRGLDEGDMSQDELIRKMSPGRIVRECTAWDLGDGGWASRIAGWMIRAGAKPEEV